MNTETTLRRKPRTLAWSWWIPLGDRIRDGGAWPWATSCPPRRPSLAEFDVSRTVVRGDLSCRPRAGRNPPRRHVCAGHGTKPRLQDHPQFSTLRDVIAVLELRIGVETEAAALAAQRRTDANLATMRQALNAVAVETGRRMAADQFHLRLRATQNSHFTELKHWAA